MRKIFIFILIFFATRLFSADVLYENANGLKQISTKYFEIIYPDSSSNTVKRLLSYADKEYERLSKLFGMKYTERITIVITPDVELVNGMFSNYPYNHIILYDFLDDASLLPFDDYFYNLFLHELTHAISLNLRNGFWQFLRNIFGSYVSPHYGQVPSWMIEGVTVSMESAEGDGRSNDPESKSLLAQHMLEDKFQRSDQVAQKRPYPKKGGLHYIYGGLFNTYLQNRYGWEKYQKLWYNNNKLILPYTFCFSFESIYGKSIDKMWEEFSSEYKITNVKSPEVKILSRGIFSGLRSDEKNLYFSDSKKRRIYKIDLSKEKKSFFIDQSGTFYVDRIKKHLYLNELVLISKTYKSKTKIFDINQRRFLKTSYSKISDLDVENGRIIAIEPDRHLTKLIQIDENKKVLLEGNEYVFFSSPLIIGENVFFIIIESNKRSIASLDKDNNLFLYKIPDNIWLDKIFKYNDKIIFNFYLKDQISLSRIGFLDFSNNEILLQEEDFFGGIYYPHVIGENLYYIRRKTDIDEVVKLSDYRDKITFKKVSAERIKYFIPNYKIEDVALLEKNYNPLPYLLPQAFLPLVLPLPDIDSVFPIGLLYTGSATPTGENSYTFLFNFFGSPFEFDSLKQWSFNWGNYSLPLDINVGIDGSHYRDRDYYTFSTSISKNIILKNSKLILYPSLGWQMGFDKKEYKNSFTFLTGLYYNQLYKNPVYPYNFILEEKIGYEIENNIVYYDGKASYNFEWIFFGLNYGISSSEIYGAGTNAGVWGKFKNLHKEEGLSKKYLSFDTGLFLRLDIDGTFGLFPIYFNYIGVSPGYSMLFTEKYTENALFVGIYLGSIVGYEIPFVPSISFYYLPDKDLTFYSFDLKLIF